MLPFATTWIDLEGIMLNKTQRTERGKYCMISFICRTLKKGEKKKLMDTERRSVVSRDGGKVGEKGKRYAFPVIK